MVADKTKVLNLIKTARGQLDAVVDMIDENRYCVDVSTQLLAVQALISKANKEVIFAHLTHCVKTAVQQGGDESDAKLKEVMGLIEKLAK